MGEGMTAHDLIGGALLAMATGLLVMTSLILVRLLLGMSRYHVMTRVEKSAARRRSVMLRGGRIARYDFDDLWVGYDALTSYVMVKFREDGEWHPHCVGWRALWRVRLHRVTPSEAFWNTAGNSWPLYSSRYAVWMD